MRFVVDGFEDMKVTCSSIGGGGGGVEQAGEGGVGGQDGGLPIPPEGEGFFSIIIVFKHTNISLQMENFFFRHDNISNIYSGNLARRVVVRCRNSTKKNWKQEVTSRGTRWGRCWQRQGWQGGSFNPVNLGSNKESYHYHMLLIIYII